MIGDSQTFERLALEFRQPWRRVADNRLVDVVKHRESLVLSPGGPPDKISQLTQQSEHLCLRVGRLPADLFLRAQLLELGAENLRTRTR